MYLFQFNTSTNYLSGQLKSTRLAKLILCIAAYLLVSMVSSAQTRYYVNHTVANLAHDFGPEVRINAVGPGATRTAALESVLTPEIEKAMLAHTPIKRLGTADDIAGAMLYFASPISEWVSGQTIFVNGGGEQVLE